MQGGARKGRVSERSKKRWRSKRLKKNLQRKKKCKSDNGDLDFSCNDVQAEESANSANTLSIESISKSENSTKSLLVIASLTETSSADENRKKIDMILSEIWKLNSKLPDETKPCKRANELPQSDEHSY